MTQIELNSSELIISALKQNKKRELEITRSKKQPLSQLIEDMPYEIQYLIEKLEDIFAKALEDEEKKKKK
jgi:hypothetical protein